MSKPILRDSPHEFQPGASEAHGRDAPAGDRRHADEEMARVLGTTPFHMTLDSSGAGIAHWKHDPLHDVVEPMSHHVIMAYNGTVQRMERRTGSAVARRSFFSTREWTGGAFVPSKAGTRSQSSLCEQK